MIIHLRSKHVTSPPPPLSPRLPCSTAPLFPSPSPAVSHACFQFPKPVVGLRRCRSAGSNTNNDEEEGGDDAGRLSVSESARSSASGRSGRRRSSSSAGGGAHGQGNTCLKRSKTMLKVTAAVEDAAAAAGHVEVRELSALCHFGTIYTPQDISAAHSPKAYICASCSFSCFLHLFTFFLSLFFFQLSTFLLLLFFQLFFFSSSFFSFFFFFRFFSFLLPHFFFLLLFPFFRLFVFLVSPLFFSVSPLIIFLHHVDPRSRCIQ